MTFKKWIHMMKLIPLKKMDENEYWGLEHKVHQFLLLWVVKFLCIVAMLYSVTLLVVCVIVCRHIVWIILNWVISLHTMSHYKLHSTIECHSIWESFTKGLQIRFYLRLYKMNQNMSHIIIVLYESQWIVY